MPVPDDDRVKKVFMQVINVLDDSITDISGYLDIVDHRHVLHILAQTDATCVRADQLAVFCREHVDGQNFVETTQATSIDLNNM